MTALRDDDPSHRRFTITGSGKIGKTRLVLKVAAALEPQGSDRVAVVPLATVRDPDRIGPAILQALGLSHLNGPEALLPIHDAIAGMRTVLVLGSIEYLLTSAGAVL